MERAHECKGFTGRSGHGFKRGRDRLALLPRLGQPDAIGRIIATLATGGLPCMTGQVISADAGMLVSRF